MNAPVVDVHTHAMPLPLLHRLVRRGLADLGAPGTARIDPRVSGVPAPVPLHPAQHDVDVRVAAMDALGVDRHVVSLPPFVTCSTAGDPRLAADVVRAGNDALAEWVGAAPTRLTLLATAPVGLPGAAAEALRGLDELGAAGIAVGSCGGGRELDDPVNDELWALLAERRAFVFLHPSAVPGPTRLADRWLPQLVGYPMETALAVARLVLGGVLDRHPLRLCLAHGGGCLPALRGRLDLGWSRKPQARTTPLPPTAYLDRLHYDTAVFSAVALRRLVEDVGVDRVLLGTDHPFDLADLDPRATVAALGLRADEADAIRGGTAAALLSPGRDEYDAAVIKEPRRSRHCRSR